MNAIKVLREQHRRVEDLFDRFEKEESDDERLQIFFEIADNLAVHASIEERNFYPAVRERQIEEQIEEAYDEHLEIKKLLLDAMRSTDQPGFDGKVAALEGAVERHVEEEEDQLFPEVQDLLDDDSLEAIGQAMEAGADALMQAGAPRKKLRVETEAPAIPP